MAKEYISARQAVWLSTVMVASTALLFLPTLVAQHARQDSWLAILLFTPLGGLYLAGTIGYLAGRHPGESLVPLSETLLTKPGGKITGLLLLVWLVFSTGLLTRQFSTFVVGTFLQQTPTLLISLSLTLLVVYGVLSGLEVIARSNDLILPAAFFIIFLIL
ncbi:MAG: GerAB/ArcD/ProY family transporter, partial [Heliobacteriaceae bacterium]|nr:GerAB/ArcD/ProY family transporter [Heliobacteriaceae bacterium]